MNDSWTLILLGIIAFATLVMAVVQIGVIVVVGRLATRVERLAGQVEGEIKPLIGTLSEVGQNAVRASSLAVAQVERADQLFAQVARRVDETTAVVQNAVVAPAREGRAVVAGVRTALLAFRELRAARARAMRQEEEDALFIG